MQKGRCLGIGHPSGTFSTVIWPETAVLSFDGRGLLVSDRQSAARVRLGDYIATGGGTLPAGAPSRTDLTEPVPPECATRVVTVNPGFEKVEPPTLRQ